MTATLHYRLLTTLDLHTPDDDPQGRWKSVEPRIASIQKGDHVRVKWRGPDAIPQMLDGRWGTVRAVYRSRVAVDFGPEMQRMASVPGHISLVLRGDIAAYHAESNVIDERKLALKAMGYLLHESTDTLYVAVAADDPAHILPADTFRDALLPLGVLEDQAKLLAHTFGHHLARWDVRREHPPVASTHCTHCKAELEVRVTALSGAYGGEISGAVARLACPKGGALTRAAIGGTILKGHAVPA